MQESGEPFIDEDESEHDNVTLCKDWRGMNTFILVHSFTSGLGTFQLDGKTFSIHHIMQHILVKEIY